MIIDLLESLHMGSSVITDEYPYIDLVEVWYSLEQYIGLNS